ncbi:hypothetical protein ACLKA6_001213 [Drosophila palustris]
MALEAFEGTASTCLSLYANCALIVAHAHNSFNFHGRHDSQPNRPNRQWYCGAVVLWWCCGAAVVLLWGFTLSRRESDE